MNRSTPGLPVHHQLPEFTQTHVNRVSDAMQPSHPLSSPSPPAPNPSSIRVFSNDSVLCLRWPKDWSFSFSISPSNDYSGQIPFRTDWLDLLAVQGTLKSLLQHHSSKASILQCSAGTTDWFQIGKGVHQGCILSPCLFNLHAEYIMRNAWLDETQARIKLQGEISITSDMQMTTPSWQKSKRYQRAS